MRRRRSRPGCRRRRGHRRRPRGRRLCGKAITVPAGFHATVFADTLGQARQLTTRPNGDVYVNTWRSPYDSARQAPAGGFLVALRDTNRDGKADQIQRFGGE